MRNWVYLFFLVVVAITSTELAWSASDGFYLKNGDHVVFYGDSITEQSMYTNIVETYVITRYPQLDITFFNSGWGGDTVRGGFGGSIDARLNRDVIALKPTVLTIMLGMNDGGYKPETEADDEKYFTGYRHIINTIRAVLPGIRITAIQPSPYDDVTDSPIFPVKKDVQYNQVLISYGKWIANYAKNSGLNVADLNTGFVATLIRAKQLNPEVAKDIIPGRVHPSFAGHLIMAEELLKSWNARPIVAAVTIDASKSTVKLSRHATVSHLSSHVSTNWTELDDALPLPFFEWQTLPEEGPAVNLVIQSSDIIASLNQELLKVLGLKSGVYSLKVDGQSVGTFNNEELAAGINLAAMKTPMTSQAMKVYEMTVIKVNIQHDKWRDIQMPLVSYSLPQMQQTIDSMDLLDKEVTKQQHDIARPVSHRFEIVPIS